MKKQSATSKASTTFRNQWTGRAFWWILASLVALDLVSFTVLHTAAEPVVFGVLLASFIGVACKRPAWVFPLAIAELIATSNGHSINVLLGGTSIGIRMAIFGVLLVVTAVQWKGLGSNPIPQQYRLPGLLFLLTIAGSVAIGWAAGHPLTSIYLDANGYLAIGYVIAAWIWARTSDRKLLLEAVGAGVAWITLKTLLFLFLFGHLHPKTLDPLYLWIRDTRLGEITLQRGTIYRIFLQSQWFLLPAIVVSTAYMWVGERLRESSVRIVWIGLVAALIASLSRTFWLALAVSGIVLFLYLLTTHAKRVLTRTLDLVPLTIASVAVLWILIALPVFQTTSTNVFGDLLRDRATQTSDAALDSRSQLLPPMLEAIQQAPLAGSGLGTHVTYTTSDPRYIDTHGTDQVSTYAFEWGWLDLLIKFGLVGALLFVLLLGLLARDLWRAASAHPAKAWLYLGLLASLLALVIAHAFSPYLNHPLGWGTLALLVALLPTASSKPAPRVDKTPQPAVGKRHAVFTHRA